MNRWISIMVACSVTICLAAFTIASAASANDPGATEQQNNHNSLVVYFDWQPDGDADAAPTPEEQMARMLAEATGSDLYEIVPLTPYPEDEATLSAIAAAERESYARPHFTRNVRDWSRYDRVYIGYPVKDEEMPMIMLSFLEAHDFTGKTVLPFDCYYGRTAQGAEITIATTTEVTTMEAFNLEAAVMMRDPTEADARMRAWMEKIGIED